MDDRAPRFPQRKKSIRYPGHAYSEPGTYFVTVCTQDRRRLFGYVDESQMRPNDVAAMVQEVWKQMPSRYPGVKLDAMIVMPDHFHAIVMMGTNPIAKSLPRLGTVIKDFKGQSTIRYFDQVRIGNWPPVNRRLWQLKYFDRIVRNEKELENIRWYIETNPVRWWSRRNEY